MLPPFLESLYILLSITFTYVHVPPPSTFHHKLLVGRSGYPVFGLVRHYPVCNRCSPNVMTPCFCFCLQHWQKAKLGNVNDIKAVYSLIFLPPVGWSRTSSRLCRTTKRNPDAVAPINSQTLPHTALWVLKRRHAGRGGRRPAELGCRELEGMTSSSP